MSRFLGVLNIPSSDCLQREVLGVLECANTLARVNLILYRVRFSPLFGWILGIVCVLRCLRKSTCFYTTDSVGHVLLAKWLCGGSNRFVRYS